MPYTPYKWKKSHMAISVSLLAVIAVALLFPALTASVKEMGANAGYSGNISANAAFASPMDNAGNIGGALFTRAASGGGMQPLTINKTPAGGPGRPKIKNNTVYTAWDTPIRGAPIENYNFWDSPEQYFKTARQALDQLQKNGLNAAHLYMPYRSSEYPLAEYCDFIVEEAAKRGAVCCYHSNGYARRKL